MSTSPILQITEIAAAQNNKYVTANQAFERLEAALCKRLSKTLVEGSPVVDFVLSTAPPDTSEAYGYIYYEFHGTLSANRNVIVPTTATKIYVVKNATSAGGSPVIAHSLTVKTSGGTGVSVANGEIAILFCDGTNVVRLNPISGLTLQTNGVPNGSQALQNLKAGSNVTVTDDGSGGVTIASTGGGGGGSIPEKSFTAPSTGTFSATRLGSTGAIANFSDTSGSGVGLTGTATSSNTNDLTYGIVSYATGASGCEFIVRLRRNAPLMSWIQMGIIIRNSSSGKSVNYVWSNDASNIGLDMYQMTNDTTFSGVSAMAPTQEQDLWLRYVDDLTNRKVYLSRYGVDWQQVFSEARTTFMTPDQIGVVINPNCGGVTTGNGNIRGTTVGMRVYSFDFHTLP